MSGKKLATIIFLLICGALSAQTITPTGSLRLTIIGAENTKVDHHMSACPIGSIKTDLTMGVNITQFFTASTRIETYTVLEEGETSFTPYHNNYYIDIHAHYKAIKLGVEHACYHPVDEVYGVNEIRGGYSRVYFEIGF